MEDGEGIPYTITTMNEKVVAEYAGVPLLQVQEMDIFTYWVLLRDGIIYNNAQTKKGREWLKNAWRLTQTEPDTEKLHQKFGRKEG